jgi:hypothetical protein
MTMYKPNAKEAALILLCALEERGERRNKPLTRARLSALTLSKLWDRNQLTEAWIREVNEWLLSAGWLLVSAGKIYGVLKTEVIENWPRVASKHSKAIVDQVASGSFDFSTLEHLLLKDWVTSPKPITAQSPKRTRSAPPKAGGNST